MLYRRPATYPCIGVGLARLTMQEETSKTFAFFSIPILQLTGSEWMVLTETKHSETYQNMAKVMFVK